MKMDGLSADFIPFSKRPARFPPNGEEGEGGGRDEAKYYTYC